MLNAGYSGTPLWKKLGLKPGSRLCVVGAPKGYIEELVACAEVGTGERVRVARRLPAPASAPVDLVQIFATNEATFRRQLAAALAMLADGGAIWASWPKKSSGVDTQVDENVIRAAALPLGLVDNKVCAVDQTWSGLRLARRRTR
ncbi:MAG: DUF3052 family protein [Phycisphaerales bacterium]